MVQTDLDAAANSQPTGGGSSVSGTVITRFCCCCCCSSECANPPKLYRLNSPKYRTNGKVAPIHWGNRPPLPTMIDFLSLRNMKEMKRERNRDAVLQAMLRHEGGEKKTHTTTQEFVFKTDCLCKSKADFVTRAASAKFRMLLTDCGSSAAGVFIWRDWA